MNESCHIQTGPDASARISGEMTFKSTSLLYQETASLFENGAPVSTIDLSAVTRADSAGLALLLEWQSAQRKVSRSLQIVNAPASLMSLATLSEASELLNMSGRSKDS